MNLLFSIDKNCIHLLQTCMLSICNNGGAEKYSAYILHKDLTDHDKKYLQSTLPEMVSWEFIEVPKNMFMDFPTTKRYPEQIYFRLAAPYLLPKSLDRILYLDVDIVVINSLLPLYQSDFEENWFMGCTNTKVFLTKLNQIRLGIDVEKDVPYINTGVLMMNLPILRENLKLEDIRKFSEKRKNVLVLPDQDILTALYGEHVKLLDNLIYNLSDRTLTFHNAHPQKEKIDLEWVRKNSVIIHYFGRNKPWKKGYIGILDVFYHDIETERKKKVFSGI